MNDYWKEMMEDFLNVGLKTFGIIDLVLIIIGIVLKIFGRL